MGIKALKNSIAGFALQILSLVMNFVIRIILVRYIGLVWLGINATLTSILSTFSLAELGLNSVVGFYLYEPIAKKDNKAINYIVNIYRSIYKYVGTFFLGASIISMGVIRFVLNGVDITLEVYLAYIILIINSVATYFLAYRRILLEADQKQYMERRIDIVFTMICNLLQIIAVVFLRNYLLFLALQATKTVLCNVIIHLKCGKIYPFLVSERVEKKSIWSMVKELKDAFCIKIASYVYVSTDSIIISTFVNTIAVGYLSNYSLVMGSVKGIARSILYPICPTIGNVIAQRKDEKPISFQIFVRVSLFILGIFVIPTLVLGPTFIEWIFGREYLMEYSIMILLALDFILDTITIPCSAFITGSGLFRNENINCITGATVNIVASLVLVQFMGIKGVLLGTVISQIVYWCMRTYTVWKYCLREDSIFWINHLLTLILGAGIFFISYIGGKTVLLKLSSMSFLAQFILGGLSCEFVFIVAFSLLFAWDDATRQILKSVFAKMKRQGTDRSE